MCIDVDIEEDLPKEIKTEKRDCEFCGKVAEEYYAKQYFCSECYNVEILGN